MAGHESAAAAEELDDALRPVLLLASRAGLSVAQRVSAAQLQALVALQRRGPMKVTSLALELGSIPSSATRLCDRLVASGLIERRTGEEDRREVFLHLTADGEHVVAEVRSVRLEVLAAALARCTEVERRDLLVGLQALADHLQG